MSFFVIVVIRDLTYVFRLLATNFWLVDFSGRSGGILGFSGLLLVVIQLLLLVFFGLIGRLGTLGGSGRGGLKSLGIIPAIHRLLRLNLVGSGMSRSTSLEDLYMSFLYVKTRL